MIYIEKVVIKGFQSHVDSHIVFKPGVNIITGNSDAGKTAVFRAIKWVLRNKPSGNAFINNNTEIAYVTIYFSDGSKIERIKSKSINQYIITNEKGDSEKLSDFGVNVPDEISNKIKMPLLNVDGKIKIDLNFSDQLDGPFLLSETPRFVAAILGFLVNQDKVDAAIKLTQKQYREYNNMSNLLINSIGESEDKLKTFPDIDKSKKLINATHTMITEIKTKKDDLTKLSHTKNSLIEVNKNLKKLKIGLEVETNIIDIDKLMVKLKQEYPKYKSLIKIKDSYINISKQLKFMQEAFKCEININESDNHIKSLKEKINKLNHLNDIKKSIQKLNINIKSLKNKTNVYIDIVKLKESNIKLFETAIETKNKKNALEILSIKYRDKLSSISNSKHYVKTATESLKEVQTNLKKRLIETDACPLSGGDFFKRCKDLIAKEENG